MVDVRHNQTKLNQTNHIVKHVSLVILKKNVWRSLIREIIIDVVKLLHHTAAKTKNICYGKSKNAVNQSTEIWWFKILHKCCKNIDDPSITGRLKNVESEAVLGELLMNLRSHGQSGQSPSWIHEKHQMLQNILLKVWLK